MGEITRKHQYTIDLDKPLIWRYSGLLLASGDNNGDEFIFALRRNGVNITQSGDMHFTASFIRADDVTVPMECVNDNGVVHVTLDEHCYRYAGRFVLTVKSETAEDKTTVAIIDGYIKRTATASVVDPEEKIVSLPELMEMVGELEQTTEEANKAIAELEQAKESGEFYGERGHGILKVTTAPTSYTTATGGKNPIKRMALSTIKTQANVDEVLVGDQISYSYYLYHIYYLDATYAYMDTSQTIRGATGAAGAAGAAGKDGKTPVKGTDYFTAEDQEELVQLVLTELGAIPVFGRVDENNDIILTALLESGTYTLKYVDANGNTTVIGTLEHNNVPVEPEGPVEIPLTWAHGDVLNKENGKVSSTGNAQYSASNYTEVNPDKTYTLTRESAMYNTCNVVCYDADNNFVSYITLDMPSLNASTASNTPVLSKQFTVPANAAKIRLRLWYESTEDAATVAALYKLIEE